MSRFQRMARLVRTLPRLGIDNLLRVAIHRARLRTGFGPRVPGAACPPGDIFTCHAEVEKTLGVAELLLFDWIPHRVDGIPDWHANPLHLDERISPELNWSDAIRTLNGRDAKLFWELSRFDWAPLWALDARDGDSSALVRLNSWILDWIRSNPPYYGINWTCGQEAAIRVMNLAMSAMVLGQHAEPTPALAWLIETSAKRILPTFSYAVAQDNNHGSAEACALFIAGTWGNAWNMADAGRIAEIGRRWLENRALRLVNPDGSPCQYSTTYHRAILETFCAAELWRSHNNLPSFSDKVIQRISTGTRWLYHLTDPATGDAPNIGANDGSHLFNFLRMPYRDFRPTVSLAARLFASARAYSDTDFVDFRLKVFDIPPAVRDWDAIRGQTYDDGGFHVMSVGSALAVMRYPRFKFRPGHADLLHLDLWVKGCNLLRDAGTYSYSAPGAEWFACTAAHNTIEFDGRSQMPRLSRFLFGDWPDADIVQEVAEIPFGFQSAASYTDRHGARHHRHISLWVNELQVVDEVTGFANQAVLRWRFAPGDWVLLVQGDVAMVSCEDYPEVCLTVRSPSGWESCELIEELDSRHYLEKIFVPVLAVRVAHSCTLTTNVTWSKSRQ